jgi:hypothetical protein
MSGFRGEYRSIMDGPAPWTETAGRIVGAPFRFFAWVEDVTAPPGIKCGVNVNCGIAPTPGGIRSVGNVAREATTVIGRTKDLTRLASGERSLLHRLTVTTAPA